MKKQIEATIEICRERILRSTIFKSYGLILLGYDIIVTDQLSYNIPAYIDHKRIYINPNDSFYKLKDIPLDHIITFVLLHEISHILFMHQERCGNRDMHLWGYATDYMINLFLDNIEKENWEIQHQLINMYISTFSDDILYDEQYNGMIEEEIYDKLQQDGKFTKKETTQSYKDFLDEIGIPSDHISKNEEIQIIETQLEIEDQIKRKIFIDFPRVESDNNQTDDQPISDDQLMKTMFETNIISRGFENKQFKTFLTRAFGSIVPWQIILQDSILIDLQKSSNISYGRPRLAWLVNPTLPYLPSYEEEEVLGTLIMIIDESASIANKDIEIAIDIVQQASSYYKNILIIKHAITADWVKLYPKNLTPDDIDELLIRQHSGGTSHIDAFNKVVEFDRCIDNSISLILVITDMVSDIKDSQSILPDRIPRIYLRTDDRWDYGDILGKVITIV